MINNPLKCWKLVKLTKPKQRDEISSDGKVAKVEKNS
jgi:hypothetical protein